MDAVAAARQFSSGGRYRAALEVLPPSDLRRDSISTQLLRAELLALLGKPEASQVIVENIRKLRSISDADKSHLEFIASRIAQEEGAFEDELQHLQRSVSYAERAENLERLCWANLELAALLTDRSGPETVDALVAGLRMQVIRLGDPKITAALHTVVALIDGKRGLLESAVHHSQLARRLLTGSPHLRIEAIGEINLTAISVLQCDLDQALAHGQAALEKSMECGAARIVRSSLGNLGYVHFMRGQFDEALDLYRKVINASKSSNENVFLARESMVQVYLAQGMPDNCLDFLSLPDDPTCGVTKYTHRYSQLTKAKVLSYLGRWKESYEFARSALSQARDTGDDVLACTASLFEAEVLLHCGRADESLDVITSTLPMLSRGLPDMAASYERTLACLLHSKGDRVAGNVHRERAERVLKGLKSKPAQLELCHSWKEVERIAETVGPHAPVSEPRENARVVQNIATLLLHVGRPSLVAGSVIAILQDSNCASGAVAIARGEDGSSEELASFGTIAPDARTQTLALGKARNRFVEVRVAPLPDIESQATLNAIAILLATIEDLEKARAEREERLTLWPIDELPYEDDDSVIAGRMRDMMVTARRIARTNVTVLVTGESGTGKEVLARAIHGFSVRSKKPFVPFNCTAVPRELLESQLFGYRRGAFTGAERDNPGLIRAARDGTLFLDEVGELGLDLQPKLLRFLESGEINPLGETSPFNVNVRIIAATNANLERLVEEGRFREDLYYRLNVIALPIPPLRERRDEIPGLVHHFVAKAASEFGKGRIRIAEETMERLLLYSWPGNVRQLQNELQRMIALADIDSTLTPPSLSKTIREETARAVLHGQGPELAVSLSEKLTPALIRVEREIIKAALRANQGRLEATAKALGISRKGLYLKRQRLGV